MSSIVDPIIDAMPQIEEAQNIVMNSLKFRGKSLCEWEKFLEFPPIHPAMSVTEINKFNLRYIEVNDHIMSNYAIAKASCGVSAATYQSALKTKQNELIETIKNDPNNKRMPGMDSIEKLAALSCANEYHAWKVNEMHVDFWKTYHDKMYLLDSRLSNLSYTLRN
jgi:hypothetical protein